MLKVEGVQKSYTKGGIPRYEITISHEGLNTYQLIRSDNLEVLQGKAKAKAAQWEELWERRKAQSDKQWEKNQKSADREQKKALADERTREARQSLEDLERILITTLDINDSVDWDSLKDNSLFPVPVPQKQPSISLPSEPSEEDPIYTPCLSFFDRIIPQWRYKKREEALRRFDDDHALWFEKCKSVEAANDRLRIAYIEAMENWRKAGEEFQQKKETHNQAIDDQKMKYQSMNPEAVVDYCEIVLNNSRYPDCFPKNFQIQYNPENKVAVLDYDLPSIAEIPTLIEVKYIQSRDDFSEKHLSQNQVNSLYDSIIYQTALRTIHELFEADVINALASIVFNGCVHSVDPGTGKPVYACIISVQAQKEEFMEINLNKVDPKQCFKRLKGVGSSKLHSMTPIAPIMKMDRDDARFVESYGVVDGIQSEDNLAAMDWEDFEHLIREVFEKEFSGQGGEVKVTRASRDGGIDAVVFDPDPLRGGKIVIQAKRYTNTVGVSAVRDLYGTVMNEGANKGILVSTSDYGPDAYEFVKGKPLVLLSGSNLLHLLEKHGHKAKIDLAEAKKILAEQDAAKGRGRG